MAWISHSEDEDSHPRASSPKDPKDSKAKIIDGVS